ncbi:tRNA wybutosine-synthesizing protein 4 [Cyphellophora attinorum]|uniref:tRNA wybutosine-synthesizing protein 4 n=1 Tax=Cyphellophora attinorum TaxID=1664694 RepID=A0A0N1HIQ7_9EURO|nr:tRNA wybutosine-synthesizing protein 4 [Phialophora attinorum]KPI36043.1 tRNA wybutosine-synthesizing protein 4 [Phialophora attinorum]
MAVTVADDAPPEEIELEEDLPSEKNADLIMGTNRSSIVSKRSVELLYLPKPHFHRFFVKKPLRRAPTINRGYWLRMRAIDWVVRKFLERPTTKRKVVLNLGCGYDPLPFQWLSTEPEHCANTTFIDIDYEKLMESKRKIVLDSSELNELFTLNDRSKENDCVLLSSDKYYILGCDLRNPKRVDRLVRSIIDTSDCVVLCVAEVSITYMAPEDSNAVLAWASKLSPDVTFCLLEQASPDRADNGFTAKMMQHFEKLNTPLRSLLKYPGNHTQTQRFNEAGFDYVDFQSLWSLWADPRFLSPSQRMALDHVEPFDEWEEFALFASHYALIVAQTAEEPLIEPPPKAPRRSNSRSSNASDFSTRTVSPYREQNEWFQYTYSQNPSNEGKTHHASAYQVPFQNAVAVHAGQGTAGRTATTSVYGPPNDRNIQPTLAPTDMEPRCCHTMTTLQNGQNLLVGGRGSPASPYIDCWLQTENSWDRVHDLPEPRYRHRAVSIIFPDNNHGVVVFGGKTSATSVTADHLLWHPRTGWRKLRSLHQDPIPRFGATFVRLGFNHGLMFGGMRQDGIVCQGLWRWRLIVRDSIIVGIKFKTSTALDTSAGIYPWLGRLGASYSVIRSELLIIGASPRGDAFLVKMDLRTICVLPKIPKGTPRPFLIGHSTHRTQGETTLIAGGGCTCFSFGAVWNDGVYLLHDREQGVHSPFTLLRPLPPSPRLASRTKSFRTNVDLSPLQFDVPSHLIQKDADFIAMVAGDSPQPKMLKTVDIGPCATLWTPYYLKSKTNAARKVVIHSAPEPFMSFQRKDTFSYNTLPFHAFLNIMDAATKEPSSDIQPHMYLRSISSLSPNSKPATLSDDWPELAADFCLPSQLKLLAQNLHSSVLRISMNVSMWLHYDVMANILFHVTSHPTPVPKYLILFPPQDIKRLSFPTGSTTSTLDIFKPKEEPVASPKQPTRIPDKSNIETDPFASAVFPPGTHPHLVTLHPGTGVFIPPLWSHTALPSPPGVMNTSVNLFFHSMPRSVYAAGRDVYGNRDLGAFEEGRRDLEKITQRFKIAPGSKVKKAAHKDDDEKVNGQVINGDSQSTAEVKALNPAIPKAVAKAYLERLAAELLEKASSL